MSVHNGKRAHAECVDQPCIKLPVLWEVSLMFSMGNLYLVPTINGEVKYQPKAQAGFFIRNYELEAGKAFVQHSVIFTSILGSQSHRREFTFPPASIFH